jgi:predicted thioesterase
MKDPRAVAVKEKLAKQLTEAMEHKEFNKVEMAKRMKTSRAALDRLLDPGNGAVTLQTLLRAAKAVGRGLRVELV